MAGFVLIVGILASVFVTMCLISYVVENFGSICRFVKAVVEVIGERIFKAFTAIFKAIQHKRSARK